MKLTQLKTLLKHIILEVQSNEMIVNKDYPPDVMGAVNVEEKFENTPKSAISQTQTKVIDVLLQRRFKIVKTSRRKPLAKPNIVETKAMKRKI